MGAESVAETVFQIGTVLQGFDGFERIEQRL
jgi:hypothetical protein